MSPGSDSASTQFNRSNSHNIANAIATDNAINIAIADEVKPTGPDDWRTWNNRLVAGATARNL